ncbi:MAG TPA: dihydrofolate reductase family protein, partial [Turneriella sp.]|nr:dihydrofolate reductase family protein [Turneriella sp.]
NLTVRTKPHSRKHPRPVIVMQTTRPIKTGLRTLANKAIGGELWISQATPNTTLQEVWPELNEDWPIYSFSRVTEIVASLKERGFNKILLEGGPTLNGFFFEAALVDEFFLTILPILWGGTTTDRTVITPNPLPITHFRLQSAERRKNEMFFHYKKRTKTIPAA